MSRFVVILVLFIILMSFNVFNDMIKIYFNILLDL
ncbi:hypothetical protein BHO_0058700 [Borrelia hermsii YBT]|nr:hypothetical protein BHO_0058700 [Borrelia hermsii YBT]